MCPIRAQSGLDPVPNFPGGNFYGKMTDLTPICAALRQAKEAAGESNQSLAQKSGVPETTVAKIMCGATSSPTFVQVAAMAPILSLDLNVLAGMEPPPVDADAAVANARLEGANILNDTLRERIDLYERGVHQRNMIICGLLGFLAFFAVAFVFYVVTDLQTPQYGLFRGSASPWAYLLAFTPVITVLICGHVFASRRARAERKQKSPVPKLDTEEEKER